VDLHLQALVGPTARLDLVYDQNGDIANLRFDAGVESQLDVSHLAADFWAASWIVVGTAPRSYQAAVVMQADGLGRPVALSTQREFQGDWDRLAAILPHLDILFVNSGEVTGLRGDALPAGINSLRAGNLRLTCVVTCGKRGAFLLHEGRLYQVPACPGNVVNTTGAGDAFNATWLLCFARTGDPAYALKVASAAASLALRSPAHTALPWWYEVRGQLEAQDRYLTVESWPFESDAAQTALAAEDLHCHYPLERRVVRI
jgi:sugar/nucleoside kinase (ribokinase family)